MGSLVALEDGRLVAFVFLEQVELKWQAQLQRPT